MSISAVAKEASDITSHCAGCGMNYFDMIDLFAHPEAHVVDHHTFLIISSPHASIDAPNSIAPALLEHIGPRPAPLPQKVAVWLAMAAFAKCERTIAIAYIQGRAVSADASQVHRKLSAELKMLSETPYPLAVALRALRPDIQQFVAAATHRLVTMAPNYGQIDMLFEECLETPMAFTIHSKAWATCSKDFRDLGCTGVAVKPGCKASIVIDGTGVAMPRRDTILLVLALLFRHGAAPNTGPLRHIVEKRPWLKNPTIASLPWWTTLPQ